MLTKRKTFVFVLSAISIFLVAVGAVLYPDHLGRISFMTLVVPDDYATIGWAVGNATAGDTVYVKSGTYNESVSIDKPLSLIGENSDNTILIGGVEGIRGGGSTVAIEADNITVSGFTIRSYDFDTPAWYFFGIYTGGNNCNITGNIIENCDCGIWNGGSLSTVSSVMISKNTIRDNLHAGIEFEGTPYNITITDNNIESNLVGITISRYGFVGSENEERFVISDNNVINNGEGIYFESSSSLIIGNNVTSNTGAGIHFIDGSNNKVTRNYVADNKVGVKFSGSTTTDNRFYYNSFVDNDQNVQITSSKYTETWDNNAVGNFWSDYYGVDNDGDGIGDPPYIINNKNQDNYPLMEPVLIPELPSIYIRADGSVEGTDKIQRKGNKYIFQENLTGSIWVEKDGVVIDGSGFWLEGSGNLEDTDEIGITLTNRTAITLKNLNIANFGTGIELTTTHYCNITNNTLTNNGYAACIYLANSSNNNINKNLIELNNKNGILLRDSSDNNIVSENIIIQTYSTAIIVGGSNNKISGNILDKNGNHIRLSGHGKANTVTGNNITNTGGTGITTLHGNSGNTISQNNLFDCNVGIFLDTTFNLISENNITGNKFGINLNNEENSSIYLNNFIENERQIMYGFGRYSGVARVNAWSNQKKGNYWSDYLTKYPNATEIPNSGIGDTPYLIDANNIDNFPLMKPVGISEFIDVTGEIEPFPTLLVAAVTVTILTLVAVGLLVFYFKRHTRKVNYSQQKTHRQF